MLTGVVPVSWVDMLAGMWFRTVQLEPWHSSRSQSEFHADGLLDVTVTQYLSFNPGIYIRGETCKLAAQQRISNWRASVTQKRGCKAKPRVPINLTDR